MAGQSNRVSYPSLRWSTVLVLLISIVVDGLVSRNSLAQAPITPSGLNTHVDLASNPPVGKIQYDITGGTRPGGGPNLFHSIGEFGVPLNNIANFLNGVSFDLNGNQLTAGLPTSNILARVTGNIRSDIFGPIQTTDFGNANLFLMNPAGFLFGPNATLNVGGSVAFTSADYLRLTDGVLFNKTPNVTQDALLSAAPVAAYGFLGSNPFLTITVQGSQFTVTEGTGISLVGGNITIQAETLDNGTVQPAKLSAPSGRINLASISSPGEIAVDTLTPGPNIDGVPPSTFGNISLSQNTQLNTIGTSGGTIRIRGGQLTMDSAFMFADSTVGTPDQSTAIAVNIEGDVTLTNRSFIQARALGEDRGGNIELAAKNVSLLDGSGVRTEGRGAGQVGDILVTATDNVVISGVIETFTIGSGNSGSIKVTASQVALADMGLIQTGTFGQKPAGDITFSVDRLDITGGGAVHTSGGDLAPSGSIYIVATDTISLSGTGQLNGLPSRIVNENQSGDTGTINIETNNLHMSDHGRINSLTFLAATEPAEPKINITVHNALSLSGESRIDVNAFETDVGALTIQAGSLALSDLSIINTETSGTGASGPINIATGTLSVTGGSQIISASTQGLGNGGDISVITTGDVTLAGQATNSLGEVQHSGIFSRTNAFFEDPSFTGNAGNIVLTANGSNVTITDGARIDSDSIGFALGNAGNITVTATNVLLNGGTISNVTEFAGNAGTTTIKTGALSITSGGKITSSAVTRAIPFFEGETIPAPTGAAGNITVQGTTSPAQSLLIDGPGSGIFTDTQGTGIGGNILIETSQSTTLTNGAAVSASSTGTMDDAGDAGMVTIHAGNTFFMQDSSVTTEATKSGGGQIEINAAKLFQLVHSTISTSVLDGTGGGGDINIDPNLVVLQNNSQILAQAIQGAGGNITITTPLFLADQSSLVSASSQFGLNGTVTIQSPTSNLSGSLGPLASKTQQVQSLLTQRCAALANGQASSFVVAGREQLPSDPGGWLSGPIALAGIDVERFGDGAVAEGTSNIAPRTSGLLANDRVSLRRLTPARFLMANFADSEATGCHS